MAISDSAVSLGALSTLTTLAEQAGDQWDSVFGGSLFSVSGTGNRTAAITTGGGIYTIVGTHAHTTGKFYFELSRDSNDGIGFGFGTRSGLTNSTEIGHTATSVEWYPTGFTPGWYTNSSRTTTTFPGASSGQRLAFAVDLTAGKVWIANATTAPTSWYGTALGDPVTGTNAFTWTPWNADTYIGWTSVSNGLPETVTMYADSADFIGTPPSGYVAWGSIVTSSSANLSGVEADTQHADFTHGLTLQSLSAIALVDIPAIQLDQNISIAGVEATASAASLASATTYAYITQVNREVLNSPNPAANVTTVDREVLRNANPHAQITTVDREVLRNANPEAHIPQFQREVLRRLTRAIFKGIQVDLAEIWFAPGVFLDFSNPANRAKFHDNSHKPVRLGDDGSTPTGSPPLLYMHLDGGDSTPLDFLIDQTGDGTMHLVTPGNKGYGWGLSPDSPTD